MGKKLNKTYHYLAILASSLILCQSVLATPQTKQIDLTQQNPPSETPNPNRIAAEKAGKEAQQLLELKASIVTQVIPKLEEALKYWRLAEDHEKEARTLNHIAAMYNIRGEHRKMLEYAQQSLFVSEALGERAERLTKALAVQFIASSYQNLGEYQKAINSYKQGISLLDDSTDDYPKMVSPTLGAIAWCYYFLGKTQKVLDTYNQVFAFWQEKGDVIKQSETLDDIAVLYIGLGENKKSIEIFQQANALDPNFKRDSNVATNTYALLGLSSCVDKLVSLQKPPNPEQSESSANQSATVDSAAAASNDFIEDFKQRAQESHTKEYLRQEAQSLEILGNLGYGRIGEYQKALEVYQQALQLRRLMGDKPGEANTLNSIAGILNDQGKKQEAINALNQALDINRQLNIRPQQADILLTFGGVYQSLAAYPQSIEAYQQALSLFRVIGDRRSEISTLFNIGNSYIKLEDYPKALNHYQQALSISRTAGNCLSEGYSLNYISNTYLASGDYQKAINVGNESLALAPNLESENKLLVESTTLRIFAKVEIKQGNYPQALEFAQRSQKSGRESGNRLIEAKGFLRTAEAYEALKQTDKAILAYQEELSLYRQMGLLPEQAQSLYSISLLERKTEHYQEALNRINEAINIIENIRKEVTSPELRTSFFATKQDYYELKINILMELHQKDPSQGYDAQAFDTSERSRARTLLELLNEANADIRQGVDPTLLEQEKTLQYKLAALDKRWSELINENPTQEQKNILEQERKTLLNQYQDIQAQIRAKSPKYAALTQPQPLTLSQVQQQVLDPDTVLLQYSLGAEKSYLWLVSQDTITTYILPAKKDIETSAKELLNAIRYDKDRPDVIAQPASQLSQIILAPEPEKLTKKSLLIVADGILNYIPFSALSLANNSLISQYELVNLPSVSSLSIIRQETQKRKPAPKALAILADPIFSTDDIRVNNPKPLPANQNNLNFIALKRAVGDSNTLLRLPGTRQEAEAILSLIPDAEQTSAFDGKANLNLANNPLLSQYRIVHFATHGIFNGGSPELSGIVLSLVNEKGNSLNGFLGIADIFNLNLPAELVILSACETGLGKEVKGEGLVGLTRGFMYAGSPRVLVSLWQVDDEATAALMTRFYKLMLEKKLPASEALRQAQLEIQQQPQWQSPYYWAAFVLQGEWR